MILLTLKKPGKSMSYLFYLMSLLLELLTACRKRFSNSEKSLSFVRFDKKNEAHMFPYGSVHKEGWNFVQKHPYGFHKEKASLLYESLKKNGYSCYMLQIMLRQSSLFHLFHSLMVTHQSVLQATPTIFVNRREVDLFQLVSVVMPPCVVFAENNNHNFMWRSKTPIWTDFIFDRSVPDLEFPD